MDVKTARRTPIVQGNYRKIRSLPSSNQVCKFWLEGRCTSNPCRFRHVKSPPQDISHPKSKPKPKPNPSPLQKCGGGNKLSEGKDVKNSRDCLCRKWASGNCLRGEKCLFQHSWSRGEGFGLLAKLEGHEKGIAGIGFPLGSNKLYTAGKDGTLRTWDCHTGKCSDIFNLGSEVGSLLCQGPWVFVGLRNVIKAWHIESTAAHNLEFKSGLVYSMAIDRDLLFAGCQNGDILVWRGSSPTSPPQLVATLKGHTHEVVSMVVGGNRLYSGSMDSTIRVWETQSFECVTTLEGHSDVVMSVLCWEEYLISCSLDRTIKVWAATSQDGRNIEVIYTHNVDHRVLALQGMFDMEGKPILLTSCNDDTVRLYELPTFLERGRIFSGSQVLALQAGPGLFFTGDGKGALSVWKMSEEPKQAISSSSSSS